MYKVKNAMQREAALGQNTENVGVAQEVGNEEPVQESFPYITLPYKGTNGENVLKTFKNCIRRYLPQHVSPLFTYKGNKLGSFFRVKDKVKCEHQSELVYLYRDDQNRQGGNDTEYVGETNVRLETRVYEHCNTDRASAVYKHLRTNNIEGSALNFSVLEKGFNKKVDRRIAEAIYAKERKPVLNVQKQTYKLELFN